MMTQLVRSVAMYSITTKIAKNSSELPRSLPRMSTARLAAQATRTGPRSRARGKSIPRMRRLASDSTSRLATR